ncbi:hypothetical protein [Bacillus massiliigorillae]|uniref:hypothetical protein n=1 Tax=Bacillus massiliigorillae TaxID=1243664 RepID=UPI0003A6D270|nr:hypothetical protein [Bacillus massiliigorillae]
MNNYKSIFKTNNMKEMNESYAVYYFPEFQTMAMMIVENEKDVEFHGFQINLVNDSQDGEVFYFTIDYSRDDKELPIIKIKGTQKADTKEPLKIILEYLTKDGVSKEEYALFEDGDYFFNKAN